MTTACIMGLVYHPIGIYTNFSHWLILSSSSPSLSEDTLTQGQKLGGLLIITTHT